VSEVFSGGIVPETGKRLEALGDGHYTIRLDINRSVASAGSIFMSDEGVWMLPPCFGFQTIPESVDTVIQGKIDPQWEWGSMRVRLIPPSGEHRATHVGNYLHGKKRPGDYTHGCICERSEKILGRLRVLTGHIPVLVC